MDVNTKNKLLFRGGNPGAVQYGNFINYYQFHPPEHRIDMLPTDIWVQKQPFIALDIGCNAGDLTLSLYTFLTQNGNKECRILGIDIDPVLIKRATEKANSNVVFKCVDFMDTNNRNKVISDFLTSNRAIKFSACFCFSITMWIHLNNGDTGLNLFLNEICINTKILVIEPQPWKCYKAALKRMKISPDKFLEYKNLKIRNCVEKEIENILLRIEGILKITETNETRWGRKIIIFKVT
ncbi:hypothetical protein FQA39_LY11159 [Lamprigera yunnana]|nr:hypothetical protein FQA39_LY11159 [Lamprigera yunnana]